MMIKHHPFICFPFKKGSAIKIFLFITFYINETTYNYISTIKLLQNHPLQKAKNPNVMHKKGNDEPTIFLVQLEIGVDAPIIFVVGQKWDANNTYGKYMSMEHIISDEKVA